MIRKISIAGMIGGLLLSTLAFAQAPAGAPAGATGMCKDNSYWTGTTKRGACRGHKGVQTWYAGADTAAPSGAAAAPATKPAASTAAPAPTTTAATPAMKKSTPAPSQTAAAGGGPGLVWVNTSSKVYHCSGDRWYGKTKSGSYMSEVAAKAAGAPAGSRQSLQLIERGMLHADRVAAGETLSHSAR